MVLVGNKCDMEDERGISYERGRQLADQLGIEFFETSAKDNVNVKVSVRNSDKITFEKLTNSKCQRGYLGIALSQTTHTYDRNIEGGRVKIPFMYIPMYGKIVHNSVCA